MSADITRHAYEPGTCQHCGKPIRRDSNGYWGARKRSDGHPWYCDASPGTGKRHEPEPEPASA